MAYTGDDGIAYPKVIISDQNVSTWGTFGQYDYSLGKLTLSAGLRLDHYIISDDENASSYLSSTVVSPRLNILYKPTPHLQLRGSYANGYSAPQIFDEDLHIEVAGKRKVIHKNANDLKQESSTSLMASVSYQGKIASADFELMAEGFYTHLSDAFANEQSAPDASNVITYTRINGGDAEVKGVNLEAKYFPSVRWDIDLGMTLQTN